MILPYRNFQGDSPGEDEIWDLFRRELPDEYISFHGFRISLRKPDIVLLVPNLGILIIENKSIRAKSIAKITNDGMIIRFKGSSIPSPMVQADKCGVTLLNELLLPAGIDSVMILPVVSYPYITEDEFVEAHLNKISLRELTFLKEDLVSYETVKARIETIFDAGYREIGVPTIAKGGFNQVLMDQVADLICPHYKEDLEIEKEQEEQENRWVESYGRGDYSCVLWSPDGAVFTEKKIKELINEWLHGTKLCLYTENEEVHGSLIQSFKDVIAEKNLPENEFTLKHNMSFRLEIGLVPRNKLSVRKDFELKNGENYQAHDAFLTELDAYSSFNYGQYQMEHAPCMDVKVTAGAGTGKTHTMVDRISFLIWKEQVEPQDLSSFLIMITFTNKSADEMKHKLFEYFLNCYMLTKQSKYFEYLESVEDVQISTIHSLCRMLLSKFGTRLGLGTDFRIATGNYRRREIIREELDRVLDENPELDLHTDMKMYFLRKRLEEFIDKVDNKNVDLVKDGDILDFGTGKKAMPPELIRVVTETQKKLDEEMTEGNSVSLKSIIRKIGQLCDCLTEADFPKNRSIRYLFVDEFQDTDNVQIELIQRFQALAHFNWFVVGDTKQCIYRFRGAEDAAFSQLVKGRAPDSYCSIALKKNYRTDQDLLEKMNGCFSSWDSYGNLSYSGEDVLRGVKILPDDKPLELVDCGKKLNEDELVRVIREAIEKAEQANDKAAILVRNNYQIEEILDLCRRNQISVGTEVGGRLFQSDPTIDLYKLLLALRYPDEPEYLYNLYTTSYIHSDLPKTALMGKSRDELVEYFDEHCGIKKWKEKKQDIMEYPIMQVLQQIVQDCHPWDRFAELMKIPGKSEKFRNYYMRNLDQIFEKLIHIANSDYLTINKLADYLEIMIATRQEADERETFEDLGGEERLICTTVHKAKGLQYDTVILPYCDLDISNTINKGNVDVIYQRPCVSYRITEPPKSFDEKGPKDIAYINDSYEQFRKDENKSREKEETRILYVAMTRAKRRLVCLITAPKYPSALTWGKMIQGGLK